MPRMYAVIWVNYTSETGKKNRRKDTIIHTSIYRMPCEDGDRGWNGDSLSPETW